MLKINSAYQPVEVKNPAIVIDIEDGTVHKVGEYESMVEHANFLRSLYNQAQNQAPHLGAGVPEIAVFELPKNQEDIDLALDASGYAFALYNESVNS